MSYKVERTIDDIEFDNEQIDQWRREIKAEMVEETGDFIESKVERAVRAKIMTVAMDRTLNAQGHNDLHRYINHELVEE